MPFGSSSWARLTFAPFSGEMLVDGDLFAVLGINPDKLASAADPFGILPASVAKSLIEGTEIVRDQELSLVLIPGNSGSSNTVTIIAEQMADLDLVADMAGGVVGFAPDGTILRWNTRMTHLFGPREKDVKGRNASDVLPCPVLYDWNSVISSAHLGHEVRVEFKPYGEKRVEGVLSRGGPGVVGLFRDSTESFKISKRLRALNRLNQAYLQSTGTGLLLLDSRLRILLSNSGFQRITGHRGSLIGLQLHDILSEDSYKWVHDASEHLFAEEKGEQSGIVSFVNQEGRPVTLRQTLRAVRNETNQALNFVCLFEDETDLTSFRNGVEHLQTNISGLARISREILKTEYVETGGVCEEILRITGSKAIAKYLYDSTETLILAGSAGNWSQGFPAEELSGFGFPSFVWSGDKQYKITSTEMGRLSNHFDFCLVLPIGKGVSNQGFLLLAESALTDSESDSDLLDLLCSLIKITDDIGNEKTARAAAEKQLDLAENFAATVLDGIPLPIAIVRTDGRVEHWNRAMELVSGVDAQKVGVEDITCLIDPEGEGFSLNSRASGLENRAGSLSADWSVKRRDGSTSAVHRWNVSVIEPSGSIYRDPSFLISGVPSISSESFHVNVNNPASSSHGNKFIERIVALLSAESRMDVLRSLSEVCFLADGDGDGVLEFAIDSQTVAAFPHGKKIDKDNLLSFQLPVDIMGMQYNIRASGSISQHTLKAVARLLAHGGKKLYSSELTAREIGSYSVGLAEYLEQFSSDSIEQNNAILHIVEGADPLAGFARTMLYSNETASRITNLLKLSVQINQDNFMEVYPDKFLTRLHSIFAGKGLRPPSLALADKMPPVLIMPDILLQCFALLCQLAVIDAVVRFKAWKSEDNEESGVFLSLQGLDESFQLLTSVEIHQKLESGRFNSGTEAAIIFRILEAAGCSLASSAGTDLTFFLNLAH